MTILEAMDDPNLFGLWFSGKTWTAWFAFLAALFGLPTTKKQATLFPNFTNRSELPKKPAKEVWMVRIGRRGGKSPIAALVAVFWPVLRTIPNILRLESGARLW
jgi:hypothetical protein